MNKFFFLFLKSKYYADNIPEKRSPKQIYIYRLLLIIKDLGNESLFFFHKIHLSFTAVFVILFVSFYILKSDTTLKHFSNMFLGEKSPK